MSESITIMATRAEELNVDTRASIIHVCQTVHQGDDFMYLFSYIPFGGIDMLTYWKHMAIGHAVSLT